MKTQHCFAKPIKYVAVTSILAMTLYLPAAHAVIIDTETAAQTAETQQDRSRLHDALDREQVKARLLALGVAPAQLQARIDALTDVEAQALAKNLDAMPAGGNLSTVELILIIILLVILL
jgi:citrate lyase beta subunit